MIYNIFLFFLSLFVSQSQSLHSNNICGVNPSQNFYISNNYDFSNIENCNIINGSLFINGDYNINNLDKLSNLERITGNLVILDSHLLNNLNGLHNLNQIDGDDLYLQKYSVVIKQNYNSDHNHGLCYADQINWTKITTKQILIEDNNNNCEQCNQECDGCFGPTIKMCQNCKHFKSGDYCVKNCFYINNNTQSTGVCEEKLSTKPILNFDNINDTSLTIDWSQTLNFGSIIKKINIYQNNISFKEINYEYTENYNNPTNISIFNLNPYTNYNFSLKITNTIGSSNMSDIYQIITKMGIPDKPINIHSISISPYSEQITFEAPHITNGLIKNYEYELSNSTYSISKFVNNTQFIINYLKPYTNYNLKIRAYTYDYFGEYMNINFITMMGIPSTPLNLNINVKTNNSCTISYDEPLMKNGIISNYNIMAFDKNNNLINNNYCNITEFTIENLIPFTDYYFIIRASTDFGYGEFTDKYNFKTLEGIPYQIEYLNYTDLKNTSVSINYEEPQIKNGILTKYVILLNNDKFETLNNYININDLIPFTNYTFNVSSCTSVGCSSVSNNINFKTMDGIPDEPTHLKITDLSNTSVNLEWQQPQILRGIFESYVYNLDNTSHNVITNNTKTNTLLINNLIPFTNYSFYVRTQNRLNLGNYESLNFKTYEGIPDIIKEFYVEKINNTTLKIYFNDTLKPYGIIESYKLLLEDVHGFIEYSEYNKNTIINNINKVKSDNKITLNNLVPNMEYCFKINSRNDFYTSLYSELTCLKMPIGYPPKPFPPTLKIGSLTDEKLTLLLNEVSNIYGPITKYILTSFNLKNEESTIESLTNYTSEITLTNLYSNNEYYFTLTVCTSEQMCKTSNNSNIIKTKEVKYDYTSEKSKEDNYNIIYIVVSSILGFIIICIVIILYLKYKNKPQIRTENIESNRQSLPPRPSYGFNNPAYQDTAIPSGESRVRFEDQYDDSSSIDEVETIQSVSDTSIFDDDMYTDSAPPGCYNENINLDNEY